MVSPRCVFAVFPVLPVLYAQDARLKHLSVAAKAAIDNLHAKDVVCERTLVCAERCRALETEAEKVLCPPAHGSALFLLLVVVRLCLCTASALFGWERGFQWMVSVAEGVEKGLVILACRSAISCDTLCFVVS